MHYVATKLAIGFALLSTAVGAMADSPAKVGSPAPALKIAKWIKGKPIAKFEPGKVYVVEFWATWCVPCVQSIPHLTELSRKYAGKISFIGVNVIEEKESLSEGYFAKVEKFVQDQGDKMDYNVAIDGKDGWMWKNWGSPSGGIPTTYVIDQKGTIAWSGHPGEERFDQVLGEILGGTYDLKAEVQRKSNVKAPVSVEDAELQPFLDANARRDSKAALAELDKAFAKNPRLEEEWGLMRMYALRMAGSTEIMSYARKLATGIYKDKRDALNSLVESMVGSRSKLENVDYKLAIEIAERAVTLGERKEDFLQAETHHNLSMAYHKGGLTEKAISTLASAIDLAGKLKDFNPGRKRLFEDRLALWKATPSAAVPI